MGDHARRIRELDAHARTLRHRARVESPVEISPEMALDVASALEDLVQYCEELAESERVPRPGAYT